MNGWIFTPFTSRFHYFRGYKSVCRMLPRPTGQCDTPDDSDTREPRANDCSFCRRVLDAENPLLKMKPAPANDGESDDIARLRKEFN